MSRIYFALYLNPPGPSFMQDMKEEERKTMQKHVVYWNDLLSQGKVVAFGPVLDPQGVYGLGIVEVQGEDEVKAMIADDPANGLNQYEYYPMKAVARGKTL